MPMTAPTTAGAFCNDIAVGPDGATYVTDSNNMQVDRLARGTRRLKVWTGDGALGPKGGILDGISILDNRIYVNVHTVRRSPRAPDTVELQRTITALRAFREAPERSCRSVHAPSGYANSCASRCSGRTLPIVSAVSSPLDRQSRTRRRRC